VCWVADNKPVLLKNGEILISFAIDVNNNSVTKSQNDSFIISALLKMLREGHTFL
jgi:hypothetical protein